MKSSDPVKLRPSLMDSGGSGANQINGMASSDNGGIVSVGVDCGNDDGGGLDGNGSGTDVYYQFTPSASGLYRLEAENDDMRRQVAGGSYQNEDKKERSDLQDTPFFMY